MADSCCIQPDPLGGEPSPGHVPPAYPQTKVRMLSSQVVVAPVVRTTPVHVQAFNQDVEFVRASIRRCWTGSRDRTHDVRASVGPAGDSLRPEIEVVSGSAGRQVGSRRHGDHEPWSSIRLGKPVTDVLVATHVSTICLGAAVAASSDSTCTSFTGGVIQPIQSPSVRTERATVPRTSAPRVFNPAPPSRSPPGPAVSGPPVARVSRRRRSRRCWRGASGAGRR